MKTPHWHYFISLEKDLVDSIEYVELAPANAATYSSAYAKMLVTTCIELEAVLKALCAAASSGGNERNIDQYRATILARWSAMHKIKVEIPRYSIALEPWASWGSGINPAWWHAYTSVKHDRIKAFSKASQENAVHAMGGLFASLIYLHEQEIRRLDLEPAPQLFHYENLMADSIVCDSKFTLPT